MVLKEEKEKEKLEQELQLKEEIAKVNKKGNEVVKWLKN